MGVYVNKESAELISTMVNQLNSGTKPLDSSQQKLLASTLERALAIESEKIRAFPATAIITSKQGLAIFATNNKLAAVISPTQFAIVKEDMKTSAELAKKNCDDTYTSYLFEDTKDKKEGKKPSA